MSLQNDVASIFDGLGELAATGTLTRKTLGTYDPATGGSLATTTTSPCKCVLDASSLKTLGYKFGEGLVRGGDLLALIPNSGLTFEPAAGDTLTLAVGTFNVIGNHPVYGGASVLLHQLLVRS